MPWCRRCLADLVMNFFDADESGQVQLINFINGCVPTNPPRDVHARERSLCFCVQLCILCVL